MSRHWSTWADLRADQQREARDWDDAWQRYHTGPHPGDRLGCPNCGAFELAATMAVHYDLEVLVNPDGIPQAIQSGDECGDDGVIAVTCQGCGQVWPDVTTAVAALRVRSPDETGPRWR
jgi:hypothetical protein